MLPYGSTKRGSAKCHPHNECSICSEKSIEKNTARKEAEKEIQEQLEDDKFNMFGCNMIESDSNPLCDCEHCLPKYENQGNGWRKV